MKEIRLVFLFVGIDIEGKVQGAEIYKSSYHEDKSYDP